MPELSYQRSTVGGGNEILEVDHVEVDAVVEVSSRPDIVPAWKTRNCCSKGPEFREKSLGQQNALEEALIKFADRKSDYIINPEMGTEFDNVDEASEYYNLYSWECGFGIRWGKKRYSDTQESRKLPLDKRYKLGQEFNYSCSVRILAICLSGFGYRNINLSRGAEEIPDMLVMKRWKRKARLDVPGHLDNLRRQDPALRAQTYMHSSLMVDVLQYMEMADKNVEAYKVGMQFLDDGKKVTTEVCKESDGMGLADRQRQEMQDVGV
ncbi:hypothetical protein HU200_021758 [Digitaria exilis]|uniref:Protein FAR1-RELATED SEQUENCE n=1 Tax=Digitaria exilis TaxID=1010633 RepID=A0A835EYV2_9POAL|nr:hypothetical protein HU200_021758 [Digitaria exilis]